MPTLPSQSSALNQSRPAPWSEALQKEFAELAMIRGVCLDIDDTLSTQGKLTSEAYEALWGLKSAGFVVVPITGRPAGWCDHIARFWPVDAVVGENGAFTFFMKDGIRKRIDTLTDTQDLQKKLDRLAKKIKSQFPQAKWASDQSYREYDLAIDFCEDVSRWSDEDVQALLKLCHDEGAHAKLSSIHVNTWFGNYDKKTGFEAWIAAGAPGIEAEIPQQDQWLYIGDSPNDEPMFRKFEKSVGVANLKKYLDLLEKKPRWITSRESGGGFAEMAQALVQIQKTR